jgi:hypothetical protein
MIHVDVESVLQNTEAFRILEEGGHPTEFFAHLNMSIEHHVTLYKESEDYKTAFDVACTKALSILKAYARELFTGPRDEVRTAYEEICDMEKRVKKKSKLSEEFNIYKHYVEDLEAYMPAIKTLKADIPAPPPPLKDQAFLVSFTPSAKPTETVPHAATNPST